MPISRGKERTVIRRPLRTWDHTPQEIEGNEAQNDIAERGTYCGHHQVDGASTNDPLTQGGYEP